MNEDVLERILRCPSLPTLPAVAVRVIELTQNVDVSLDELGRTIQNDQGLSAKILRTVNSSFYGLRRRCSTINQALVMLGLSVVKSLALGFSLVSSLGHGDDEFDFVAYWRRGLYTGVGAKLIARQAKCSFEDEAFLGGLLQDVGMMAIHQALKSEYRAVLRQAGPDHRALVRYELAALEVQHPEVGAALAQRWKLPDELIMPVRYHERPTAAPPEFADLVRCVGLGNIAHDVLTDESPGEAMRLFIERAASWFDIGADAATDLLTRIAAASREVSSLFRLNTGPFADAEEVIARAQAQLAELVQTGDHEANHGQALGDLLVDGEEVDALTGTPARSAHAAKAEAAFESARSGHSSVAYIQLCIDGFGRIVQAHGSEVADAILVETAALLTEHFDDSDASVCRWDNATFAVLLPECDRAGAVRQGADFRARLEHGAKSWHLLPSGGALPVTVSLGVAAADGASAAHFGKLQSLVTAAARAMEAASVAGGNCVRAFVPKVAA